MGRTPLKVPESSCLKTFHNKDQIGHEETRAIKQMFGPFPASAAELSCASVGRLVAQIGESQVDAFIQTQSSLKTVNRSSIFGQNIAFSFDTYVLDAQDTLPWSEGTDVEQDVDFHSFLNNHVVERRAGGDRDDAYSAEELEQRTQTAPSWDKRWRNTWTREIWYRPVPKSSPPLFLRCLLPQGVMMNYKRGEKCL